MAVTMADITKLRQMSGAGMMDCKKALEEAGNDIEKAMEIYKKYDVTVISDEIWSDIILYGNEHIPTQSVSEDARNRTIALYAPSKTFNLARLIGSYHIIYNKRLKDME